MSDVAKTPREELECKKKYLYEHSMFWECNDGSKCQILEENICEMLNEQQELIEELHISDHMGWGRAEKFEKELKQKKIYIKRLEYKVQKFKEMNGEQQATINELQSIINHIKCEENCEDYDYCCETVSSLWDEIKHLKEENEQLKNRLNGEFIKECSIR